MTTKLEAIRRHLGLTQVEMAGRLGLTPRALQDIEGGKSKERTIHVLAAERVSLSRAVANQDPALATGVVRDLALRLAHLITPPPAEISAETER